MTAHTQDRDSARFTVFHDTGATNELFTVPGAGHGNFNPEERTKIYLKIKDFLANNGL